MNHHYNTSVILPIVILVFILFMNCAGAATWTVDPTPGVGNYTTVQAAINAAAVGDTILVQSGTYYEHVVVNKQLILQGVDSGSGLPVIDGNASGSAITLSANNCILENFSAVNSGSNYMGIYVTSSGNTISNNNASGNGYGIYLDSSSSNTVSGNTANGNGFYGIFLITSSNNAVSDNIATGNIRDGIHLTSSSIGNTVSGNAASGNIWQGIILISSGSNAILGNTASNNSKDGIQIYSSSGNAVSGNIANGNSLNGIEFYQSNGNDISYNSATGNVQAGIQLGSSSNNAISENTASNNIQNGIRITFSASNVISGNTANGNSLNGIDFYQSSGNDISDNAATDNLQAGIQLDTSSNNNTVTSNIASSNSGQGIWLASSTGNTVSDNSANNNHYGIWLSSSAENTISGNTATGNIPYGIVLSSSSASNIVSGNTATGNTQHGILLDFSTANNITGNNVANNSGSGFYLSSSTSNAISGNTIASNGYGILTISSNSNTIMGNAITSNSEGIRTTSSSTGNTISGNTIASNGRGIRTSSSPSNTISDNTITNSSYDGIYLVSSNSNNVSDNNVTGNSRHGICLLSLTGCIVSGNTVGSNKEDGIRLESSSSSTLSGNDANSNAKYGIQLKYSNSNSISGNTASGNSLYGIYLDSSSSNTIYLNAFDNTNNGWSNGANHWNATSSQTYEQGGQNLTGLLGNIWSDYDGIDCDGDGVGETPYDISGGSEKDYHPLGGIEASPSMEVEKRADRTEAEVGEWISYTIRVNNTGNVNLTNVRAWDNLTSTVWELGTLQPGQNYTNTTSYRVNLTDFPGPLANELWANGTSESCGGEVNDSATETVMVKYNCTYGPRTHTVCASGCNYTTIQAAINDACPGDTILVQSGTYSERVVVNKTLTLQGVGAPVVDAGGLGNAFTLTAPNCTLQGFVARNSGFNFGGIVAVSSGNTISGNTATGSRYGIHLASSSGNTIFDNTATGNIINGIDLYQSTRNNISGNTVTGNSNRGIVIYFSNGNAISGNTASGNPDSGIFLQSANSNTVMDNSATGSNYGIKLFSGGSSNNVLRNSVSGNNYGIWLESTGGSNTIYGNTATGNSQYGIYLVSSSSNTIYLNTFDNTNNAWSNGANHWNATSSQTYEQGGQNLTGLLGNIWSDYEGFDCDGDGVGDTPYDISGGSEKDYHPLGGSEAGAALAVEKIAEKSVVGIGEQINYTIWVNNTGNVSLTGVRAEDNLTGSVWTVGTLAPGQNYTNTTSYQMNASDLPGPLVNQLQANGTDPCGTEVNDSAIETVVIQYNSSISIRKFASSYYGWEGNWIPRDLNVPAVPGEAIYYMIILCNTGNLSFKDLVVHDSLFGDIYWGSLDAGVCASRFGLRYNVTEQDICNGSVNNSATVNGTDYYGNPVAAGPANITIPTEYNASISIHKIANTTGPVAPGEVIEYIIRVCNTGNLTLYNVTIEDNRTGIIDVSSVLGSLNASQCGSFNRTYNVTEQDISNGSVVNSATVTAKDYCGNLVAAGPVNITIPAEYNASISIRKLASSYDGDLHGFIPRDLDVPAVPGEAIYYTILICNTGNLSLKDLVMHDSLFGDLYWGSLDAGHCGYRYSLRYNVTEQDICNGSVNNSATVTGTDYYGNPVEAGPANITIPTEYNSSISIYKIANTTGPVAPGEVIEYMIWVCNTGNLTLYNVTIEDNRTGIIDVSSVLGPLNASQCGSFNRTYTVTSQDISNGSVFNSATVTANDACGETVSAGPALFNVTTEHDASIEISKLTNITAGSPSTWVNFTMVAKNTGNATLGPVIVTDTLPFGLDQPIPSSGGSVEGNVITWDMGTMHGGSSKTIWLEAHINGSAYGLLTNQAEVEGKPARGDNVTDDDSVNVTAIDASIEISKLTNVTAGSPSTWVNYTMTVTNTGNATLGSVIVTDTLPFGLDQPIPSSGGSVSGNVITWNLGTMHSGESETIWLAAHINGSAYGLLTNQAEVEGKPARGDNVTDSDAVNVNITNIPELCIEGWKIDRQTGEGIAGWTITLYNDSGRLRNTTTNFTGWYEFCYLEPGQYTVCEGDRSGWTNVTPSCIDVDLGPASEINQNFTNTLLPCIEGWKIDHQTGEGIAGWTITLYNDSGILRNTTTNFTGWYEFCYIEPGQYTVCEGDRSGWTNITPSCIDVSLDFENELDLNFTNELASCPKAINDSAVTVEGSPIAIRVLSNDINSTDAVICAIKTPRNGTAAQNGTSIIYTPDSGFCGPDSFNYSICKENSNCNPSVATVFVAVSCAPCPKAINDSAVTVEGSSIAIRVLSNDINSTDAVICAIETPMNGTATQNGTSIIYTPDSGFCGPDSFNYSICKENSHCNPSNATVYIDVVCAPCPRAINDSAVTRVGRPIAVAVLSNDINSKDAEICALESPRNGMAVQNGTSIIYTPDSGFCGPDSFDYSISTENSHCNSSVATVYIDVVCDLCLAGCNLNNCTGEELANWTIELRDESGLVINTTETDSNGDYSFCSLEPGNYTVCELLQSGWKNVTPLCIPVTLGTDSSEDNDFLNTPPVCISGRKINDCTEEGIAGWKITLYDALGEEIGTAITDANGRYSFCRLDPGIYYLCEEKREGWTAVPHKSQAVLPSMTPITCNMPWCDDNCVCVDLDCDKVEVDFRNIPKSLCINGSKINNCTGEGIAGWGIYLYDAAGKNIRATQTDRNGHYSFCGLPPGQYRVCEEIRDGWIPVTYINHSGASCLPEDCTCDVCNNCIPVILDCENSEENDFENIPPTSIKGKVIDDCTGLGLKGWTVKLSGGGIATPISTTTKADGSYEFKSSASLKLTAGSLYWVCEVVKDGYTPVTYHANNTSRSASQEYCVPVFLDCGEIQVEDFENIPPLLISGHEFNHCTGEGLDGWTVHLKDGAGNILETTTTDEAGYYQFSGRQPGWYTVCEKEIPEGWTSFRDDPNSPAMAPPGTSGAPEDCEKPKCIVVRLDYCEDSIDNDFENIPTFCIKGIVYNNSTTVANFPVKIENSDGTQVLSIPTDATSEYKFCGLKAGTYTVCVDKPGWTADEPCVIVYLDCQDEEHDFNVYRGRSNIIPSIEQPAITLDDSTGAIVQGAISVEPAKIGDDSGEMGIEPAARETLNP